MKFPKSACWVAVAAAVVVAFAQTGAAQIEKEKSIFTITEPTEIGNKIVPPGTYLIRVVPLSYNRNVVQVTSEDGTKVFAAALATPHPKKLDDQTPNSRFTYYPTGEGKPKALRTWFAPSTPFGEDIVYPKKRAAELAAGVHESVVAIPEGTSETEYKTVPYTTVTREGTEIAYSEPAPASSTSVAQTKALPRTASRTPLTALLGAAALGAALALRHARSS
jgi:hypothetical protein